MPEIPSHLSFVLDRMAVLSAAHGLLTKFEADWDVSDLLDVAGWLAGDNLPEVDSGALYSIPDDDSTGEQQTEETAEDG